MTALHHPAPMTSSGLLMTQQQWSHQHQYEIAYRAGPTLVLHYGGVMKTPFEKSWDAVLNVKTKRM